MQVAAALAVARVDTAPPPSPTLEALLAGPVDWTTTAAIIALLDSSFRNKATALAVASILLRASRRKVSPIWFSCGLLPSLLALLEIPGLPGEVYATARDALDRLEMDDG